MEYLAGNAGDPSTDTSIAGRFSLTLAYQNRDEAPTMLIRNLFVTLMFCGCVCAFAAPAAESTPRRVQWALAIHGGAGVINRGDLTAEKESAYRASLAAALGAGAGV